MVHGDAEGVKTGRRLAVKAHGRFMKGMPGPALAGLKRLDARSPKTGYGARDSGIDLPITPLRRLSGHGKAYSPVSDLGGTSPSEVRGSLPLAATPDHSAHGRRKQIENTRLQAPQAAHQGFELRLARPMNLF